MINSDKPYDYKLNTSLIHRVINRVKYIFRPNLLKMTKEGYTYIGTVKGNLFYDEEHIEDAI